MGAESMNMRQAMAVMKQQARLSYDHVLDVDFSTACICSWPEHDFVSERVTAVYLYSSYQSMTSPM